MQPNYECSPDPEEHVKQGSRFQYLPCRVFTSFSVKFIIDADTQILTSLIAQLAVAQY
jgi:hypothetical protein